MSVHRQLGGGHVLLMAPTGLAARRMAESTGYAGASTMHSAMGLVTEGEEPGEAEREPLHADLIIVDEFTMADMVLAFELFSRIVEGTRVLLLGDVEQLPSVGPGNVFRELLECGRIPTTVLDVIYRQADTSRIVVNAAAIRQGSTKLQYGDDFVFEACADSGATAEAVERFYLEEVRERGVENVQILSAFRTRGACSVKALNEEIRELGQSGQAGCTRDKGWQPSLPVERPRDADEKQRQNISNGDVGFISHIYVGEDNDSVGHHHLFG